MDSEKFKPEFVEILSAIKRIGGRAMLTQIKGRMHKYNHGVGSSSVLRNILTEMVSLGILSFDPKRKVYSIAEAYRNYTGSGRCNNSNAPNGNDGNVLHASIQIDISIEAGQIHVGKVSSQVIPTGNNGKDCSNASSIPDATCSVDLSVDDTDIPFDPPRRFEGGNRRRHEDYQTLPDYLRDITPPWEFEVSQTITGDDEPFDPPHSFEDDDMPPGFKESRLNRPTVPTDAGRPF